MSVEIPKMAVVFGSVTPPQGDVIDCRVHLGCTKEVGSFEVLLQNWNKKYSPGGTSPITVGLDGHIDIGRGSNVPQIITCRVESVRCESTPTENYIRVSGRCWGEKLFRRVVTKTYENKKGEEIVGDLIDYYVGLSHVRTNSALTADAPSGQKNVAVSNGSLFTAGMLVKIEDNNAWEYNEVASILDNTLTMLNNLANTYTVLAAGKVWIDLIEKTDTTYTKLEYDKAPVFDVLKYIAESADKNGVIGYDFRAAPDAKLEFFSKGSKTSPLSLSEKIEVSEYRKDIHRIRNRIEVYGSQDKPFPVDMDGQLYSDTLTEDLTVSSGTGWNGSDELVHAVYGKWTVLTGSTNLALDTAIKYAGAKSVKVIESAYMYYSDVAFQFNAGKEINADQYPQVIFAIYVDGYHEQTGYFRAKDINGKYASKRLSFTKQNEWEKIIIPWGSQNAERWDWVDAGFDWTKIVQVDIAVDQKYFSSGVWRIDMFHFGYGRWSSTQEDTASQSAYGLRELVEVDEELTSGNSCERRAKALLAHLKDPAEYLIVKSTVIDYGATPLLPGDKIHVTLPNENVDSDFRIESVEYRVDAKTQTLEVTLELGKVPPLLADYLYGLRSTTVTVEKLARTKLGRFKIPTMAGAGVGVHHVGHEAGDENGSQWPSLSVGGWDRISGWISPKHIGPYSDTADIMRFRTKNKAGSAVLEHQFQPSDDGHGIFGVENAKWKEVHTLYLLLYTDGYMQIKTVGEANPKVRLSANMLQFGPGGASALDTWLKRIAANQFESSGDIIPDGDNVRSLGLGGATPKRWANIYAVNINLSSHLIPGADNTYDLGEATTPKRWRDLYLAGAIKALAGGVAVHLLPNANATYELGSGTMKWSNLYVSGVGDLGWLNVGGFTVITNARVLQNVTAAAGIITSGRFPLARLPDGDSGKFLRAYGAGFDPMYALLAAGDIPNLDASKITSGRFPLARLPEGTAGYVLEAEGGGFDPMYVNPNGRYQPASHAHSHGSLTGIGENDHHAKSHSHAGETISPSAVNCNTMSIAVSCNRQYTHPSSQQCVYAGSVAWENCPRFYCVNYNPGDIVFANKFRITEAENLGLSKGLAFLNSKGKVLMMLDGEGNLHVAGKVKEGLPRKAKAGVVA